MNRSILFAEILTQLENTLFVKYEPESLNSNIMTGDAKASIKRILDPIVTRLDIEAEDLTPADLNRLTRKEWIDICAHFIAYWNPYLEQRCQEEGCSEDSVEVGFYTLNPVQHLLFASTVLILDEESQLLNTAIERIRALSLMYELNSRSRALVKT